MPTKSRQSKCPIPDPDRTGSFKDVPCTPELICPGYDNLFVLGSLPDYDSVNFECFSCEKELYFKAAWTEQHKGLYICIPDGIRENVNSQNATLAVLCGSVILMLGIYRNLKGSVKGSRK